MSAVNPQRFNIIPVGQPNPSANGLYVRFEDWQAMHDVANTSLADQLKLEAEAQALREEVAALRSDANSYQSGYDEGRRMAAKHRQSEVEQLTRDVEALRARVVVPDVGAVYAGLGPRERLFTSPENIQVVLEAIARLNGKAVSEGLLLRLSDLFPADMGDDGSGRAGWLPHVRETIAELRILLGEGKEHE